MIRDACERGVAAVVVTHDAQLASWADRVVFLRDGRTPWTSLRRRRRRPALASARRPPPSRDPTAGTASRAEGPGDGDGAGAGAGAGAPPGRRRGAGPAGRGPLGVAAVPAGVAPAVPDLRPRHGGRRRHHRRLRRGGQHARRRRTPALARRRTPSPSRRNNAPRRCRRRGPRAPVRPGGADRERDPVDPGLDQHLPAPGAGPARAVRRADALARLGPVPVGADEVAVTSGVASAFHLRVGDTWRVGGVRRQVVGIVENPQSLLDEFALGRAGAGAASHPGHRPLRRAGRAAALDRPPRADPGHRWPSRTRSTPRRSRSPPWCSGMLLIALVSVGGFTVLAQRRLRSIGMLESTGATDRHVRLVVRANGAVVGRRRRRARVGAGAGGWLAYRPSLEQSAHHVIGVLALPWVVVVVAMVLAVGGGVPSRRRGRRVPSRGCRSSPALSGRPAPPAQIHRSAVPGVGVPRGGLPAARLLRQHEPRERGRRVARAPPRHRAPHPGADPARALPPLARRPARPPGADRQPAGAARPGPLPGPLGLGAGGHQRRRAGRGHRHARRLRPLRQRPRLRGPEPRRQPARACTPTRRRRARPWSARRRRPARPGPAPPGGDGHPAPSWRRAPGGSPRGLGAQLVPLERRTPAQRPQRGPEVERPDLRGHAAAPAGLRDHAVRDPAERRHPELAPGPLRRLGPRPVLRLRQQRRRRHRHSGRTGWTGRASRRGALSCRRPAACVPDPVIQEVAALPSGTSAPNTVVTEHAMREFHLTSTTQRLAGGGEPAVHRRPDQQRRSSAASTSQLSVESKNDQPTSAAVITWATDLRDRHRPRRARHVGRASCGARPRATSARSPRPGRPASPAGP